MLNHPFRLLLGLCLLVVSSVATFAAEKTAFAPPPPPADGVRYYVSATTGNDANPGTLERPFRTIGRIAPFLQPGQICVVRAGVYRELLRPETDGTAEKPVVFMAAPNEKVVLTGLDVVKGWSSAGGGLWRAHHKGGLTALQTQVFFDGVIGHQGRWPNRTNDNLLEHQGVPISAGSDITKIVGEALPANLPKDYFDGATVWAISGSRWSSWRSPVTGFNPAAKTISYQPFTGTKMENWVNKHHKAGPGVGSAFYVSGGRKLVDAPREWFYDEKTGELLVMPPAGFNPTTSVVELQTRLDAIDFSGRSHVTVKGFTITGAAVKLQDAEHCTVERLTITYPTAARNAQGTNSGTGRAGVMVRGSFNTVRECSIEWSWDSGIEVYGVGNRVINNLISNVNCIGSYASGIFLAKNTLETIVAWNTIRGTGRDGMIVNGQRHRIVHNRISRFASICDDGGGLYTAGGGTDYVFAYNWVHDAGVNSGMKSGIYLDNFTTGVIVHHNVVWNVPLAGIAMNRPSCYHIIAHNTLLAPLPISNVGTGGWANPRNTAIGTRIANNLLSGAPKIEFGAVTASNVVSADNVGFDPATGKVSPTRAGLAEGTRIPGISPVAEGVKPDVGAFQTGVDYPVPGHDFSKRRETWFDEPRSVITQRVQNNIFLDKLDGWKTNGEVGTVFSNGFNRPGPESRNTVHFDALELTGVASAEQVVTGLVPDTVYTLHAFRKADTPVNSGVSVIFPDGREYRMVFDPNPARLNWQMSDYFEFKVPSGQTEARVVLWKEGEGKVYFDHIGFMQKWPNINSVDYRPTYFAKEPQDVTAAVGESVKFTALSKTHSTRTNRWEWRPAGADDWAPLSSEPGVVVDNGRDAPSVTINPVKPEFHGALFRVVSTNVIGGPDANRYTYQAFSRPAKMTVTGVAGNLEKAAD